MMGFGKDAAIAATRQCSTAEEGLEWLLKQPAEAFGKMGPAQAPHDVSSALPIPEKPVPPPMVPVLPKHVGPPGANLAEQLKFLGFGELQSDMASKSCLTIDTAMEWLTTQRVSVHL